MDSRQLPVSIQPYADGCDALLILLSDRTDLEAAPQHAPQWGKVFLIIIDSNFPSFIWRTSKKSSCRVLRAQIYGMRICAYLDINNGGVEVTTVEQLSKSAMFWWRLLDMSLKTGTNTCSNTCMHLLAVVILIK